MSGAGLPATVDADGYDTQLAAEAVANAHHRGEYRVEPYEVGDYVRERIAELAQQYGWDPADIENLVKKSN